MGLFDRLKQGLAGAGKAAATPQAIEVVQEPNAVCAPVSGRLVAMSEVPDPVFGSEMLGGGCGIWPEGDVAYAPVSGTVTVTMGHAVGLRSDDGIEVLVHIGIDTVDMEGTGFTGFVKKGDTVVAGAPILRFDRDKIAEAGHDDVVVLAISNTKEFSGLSLAVEPGENVASGAVAVRVER